MLAEFMKTSTIIIISLAAVFCLLVPLAFKALIIGFHSTDDATLNADLWGGYEPDSEYVLVDDVFLQRASGGMAGKRYVLLAEGSLRLGIRHESAPETIESYEANPKEAAREAGIPSRWVIGIVREGTKLRLVQLEHHKGWSAFFGSVATLTPYAEILEGEFAGEKVDLTNISWFFGEKEDFGVHRYKPEEKLIQVSED